MPVTLIRRILPLLALVLALLPARPAAAGYTHYWRWHARPDPTALERSVDEMLRIADARRVLLADDHRRAQSAAQLRVLVPFPAIVTDAGPREGLDAGEAAPLVSSIVFNGIGDEGHEAFGFPLAPFTADNPAFQFVKTAGKPYDAVVTACLIVARDHFPREVLSISSDGDWNDWAQGAALYERVLARRAKSPLDPPRAVVSDTTTSRDAPPAGDGPRFPERASRRKRLLLAAIAFLALAIVFVMTREVR